MRRLPPLKSLQAFEAAARWLSFSKAAEELFVTPAAISQQIKQLEAFFGEPLFHRKTRSVTLTDAAKTVLPLMTEMVWLSPSPNGIVMCQGGGLKATS